MASGSPESPNLTAIPQLKSCLSGGPITGWSSLCVSRSQQPGLWLSPLFNGVLGLSAKAWSRQYLLLLILIVPKTPIESKSRLEHVFIIKRLLQMETAWFARGTCPQRMTQNKLGTLRASNSPFAGLFPNSRMY